MTDRSYGDHLEDILEAAEKAQAFTTGLSYKAFVEDDKTVFAVIRALEVIGEATKRLPLVLGSYCLHSEQTGSLSHAHTHTHSGLFGKNGA